MAWQKPACACSVSLSPWRHRAACLMPRHWREQVTSGKEVSSLAGAPRPAGTMARHDPSSESNREMDHHRFLHFEAEETNEVMILTVANRPCDVARRRCTRGLHPALPSLGRPVCTSSLPPPPASQVRECDS